jgi:diadenosine tetraphosphate (Ap4A) HIT family hydrolase
MSLTIRERIERARSNADASLVCRMPSGWLILADAQPVEGYCILMSDPIVTSLNELKGEARGQYLADTVRVGDALLSVTNSHRINYETWGNIDPSLHTHIVPRYMSEPEELRRQPLMKAYDLSQSLKNSALSQDRKTELSRLLRDFLASDTK